MKTAFTTIGAMLALGFSGCSTETIPQKTVDAYLDQSPPGAEPVVFAPNIVNTTEHREIEGMFGADMNTIYFIRRPWADGSDSNVLAALNYKENEWRKTVIMQGVSEPSISPDGKKIYFKNKFIERTTEGWSELKNLGAPFMNIDIMRLSAASNGTLYFDTFTPDLDAPLKSSRLVDGKYEAPESLGPQFGVGKYNAHPFIAPDESYVIWDSRREDGYGSSDLYISYRTANNSWGPAINMGDKINTPKAENYPSVSPDGEFLIFDRRGEKRPDGETSVDIYWVDAQIIDDLRPKN